VPAPAAACPAAEEAQATKEMREEFRPITIDELEGKKRRVSWQPGWQACCVCLCVMLVAVLSSHP
jgi:hypothetical protein